MADFLSLLSLLAPREASAKMEPEDARARGVVKKALSLPATSEMAQAIEHRPEHVPVSTVGGDWNLAGLFTQKVNRPPLEDVVGPRYGTIQLFDNPTTPLSELSMALSKNAPRNVPVPLGESPDAQVLGHELGHTAMSITGRYPDFTDEETGSTMLGLGLPPELIAQMGLDPARVAAYRQQVLQDLATRRERAPFWARLRNAPLHEMKDDTRWAPPDALPPRGEWGR